MNKKIALFYGGKISQHLVLIRAAARDMGVKLDLVSYNKVMFDTEKKEIKIKDKSIDDYGVLFFRTTGKHWEEVDLIVDNIKNKDIVIVDPIIKHGKPSQACKAWQMLNLKRAGIEVPKTVYGSLWTLHEYMKKENEIGLQFPVIVKGSGGDRGTRVFKADSLENLEKLVRELRKTETQEGKRYMLQEFIENDGDYRVLILGEKVLGVMRRFSNDKNEFRNNFSTGGGVEISDLPEDIKNKAIEAAKVCQLMVAGVDVILKKDSSYVILEVNKGPQFWGFMKATGIDVPKEIVKFLVSLKN